MINFCPEEHLRRRHRIICGQEELKLELPTGVRGSFRAIHNNEKVPQIRLAHLDSDSRNRFLLQTLSFLCVQRGRARNRAKDGQSTGLEVDHEKTSSLFRDATRRRERVVHASFTRRSHQRNALGNVVHTLMMRRGSCDASMASVLR